MRPVFLAFGWVEIILFLTSYILLFFTALFLLAKREKTGGRFFGWLLVMILFPFLGSACYLVYYMYSRKRKVTN